MNEVEKLNAIIDSYQPRLQALKEIKEIVSGNYEAIDSQTIQDIRKIINKAEEE